MESALLPSFEKKAVLVHFFTDFVHQKLVSILIVSTLSFNLNFSVPVVNEISQGKFHSYFIP